ncbi:MAG: (2Fe-2S)-binding protein [Rhodobacteraceae bacterium]|nr:(2Fe-2S)-binding protein [Paracoccaceae bacterium]
MTQISRPGPPRQDQNRTVRFTFEGRSIEAPEHATVAAALIAAGVTQFGSRPVSGAPRGAFCMMGSCFDCMVVIDGVANRQACMEIVRPGMAVQMMNRLPVGTAEGYGHDGA